MRNLSYFLATAVLGLIALTAFVGFKSTTQSSASFGEVIIGKQIWMSKNLDVEVFSNGDSIPQAKSRAEWVKANDERKPAWCYYKNDPVNRGKYGKLYNWYAVNDNRGIAPKGWHVPSDSEFEQLFDFFGGRQNRASEKMKSKSGWERDGNGSGENGFSVLPGGYRDEIGAFEEAGLGGHFWISTSDEPYLGISRAFYYNLPDIRNLYRLKGYGLSIRCIKGEITKTITSFKEVTIGKQVWMSENLNVDRFRNGDLIPEAKSDAEWEKAGEEMKPAWCYYDNTADNKAKYGKLYNWFAVNDQRGLAPIGWHMPSDQEWTTLTNYLGGKDGGAVTKLKSTNGWGPSSNGTNESGFSGLPGGYRTTFGSFNDIGNAGCWWSSSEESTYIAWSRGIHRYYDNDIVTINRPNKKWGLSVRCVKD